MKILFQGDSITDAFRRPEEINPAFQLGNGYAFLAAAELAARQPARGWQFFNRGVSGEGVRGLRRRWQQDALELKPDILSLLIGVNDTIQAQSGDRSLDDVAFGDVYTELVDRLVEARPGAGLILLEPFLLPAGDVTRAWQDHLRPRQKFVREFACARGAVFVPLQSILDRACDQAPAAYWAYDGIHPTHAGFRLVADAWLAAAEPLLK